MWAAVIRTGGSTVRNAAAGQLRLILAQGFLF
jgi:hypothetical protein